MIYFPLSSGGEFIMASKNNDNLMKKIFEAYLSTSLNESSLSEGTSGPLPDGFVRVVSSCNQFVSGKDDDKGNIKAAFLSAKDDIKDGFKSAAARFKENKGANPASTFLGTIKNSMQTAKNTIESAAMGLNEAPGGYAPGGYNPHNRDIGSNDQLFSLFGGGKSLPTTPTGTTIPDVGKYNNFHMGGGDPDNPMVKYGMSGHGDQGTGPSDFAKYGYASQADNVPANVPAGEGNIFTKMIAGISAAATAAITFLKTTIWPQIQTLGHYLSTTMVGGFPLSSWLIWGAVALFSAVAIAKLVKWFMKESAEPDFSNGSMFVEAEGNPGMINKYIMRTGTNAILELNSKIGRNKDGEMKEEMSPVFKGFLIFTLVLISICAIFYLLTNILGIGIFLKMFGVF